MRSPDALHAALVARLDEAATRLQSSRVDLADLPAVIMGTGLAVLLLIVAALAFADDLGLRPDREAQIQAAVTRSIQEFRQQQRP